MTVKVSHNHNLWSLNGVTRGGQYIGKMKYNFSSGIEKFKSPSHHMPKKYIYFSNKDQDDRAYNRSKSYMQSYLDK
jgi:hypothetical protein